MWIITQLIFTFALHKAGFLMMWLMFLVVILSLFPVGKKSNFITVIMVDKIQLLAIEALDMM